MNNKYGTVPAPETIRFERLLNGPIERVWDYLTKSELKAKWLAAGEVQPGAGRKVEQRFHHKDLSKKDDPIPDKYKPMEDGTYSEGRVVDWEPPNLLSYTWGEESGTESLVTFELIPKGDKVLLTLIHQRLGNDPTIVISVASGWHTHLGILVDRLKDNEPKAFWNVHTKMEKEYGRIINNQKFHN